jgi:hypothetical protein
MKSLRFDRRGVIASLLALAAAFGLLAPLPVAAETDPLPSWNEGPAKKAIIEFVQATTDWASPKFVPPQARIATFDQDGTLWVEHPMYSQVVYCLDRVPALVKAKPELADVEPFKTVLSIGQALWLKELETYKEFPPMQDPASYNLDQVMNQLKKTPPTPSQ